MNILTFKSICQPYLTNESWYRKQFHPNRTLFDSFRHIRHGKGYLQTI